MPLPDIDTVVEWRGRTVRDSAGHKIGTFEEIFLDAETDRPEWAGLKTGLLGRRRLLVPLSEARDERGDLRVPFEKAHVEAAPSVEGDAELSKDEEARLYRHYGLDSSDDESASVLPAGADAEGRDDEAGAAPAPEGRDDALLRSEEEVRVGKRVRPRERVRLKRYLVTEHVTKKVPVQREEVRLEQEPVAGEPSSEPAGEPPSEPQRG